MFHRKIKNKTNEHKKRQGTTDKRTNTTTQYYLLIIPKEHDININISLETLGDFRFSKIKK